MNSWATNALPEPILCRIASRNACGANAGTEIAGKQASECENKQQNRRKQTQKTRKEILLENAETRNALTLFGFESLAPNV